MTSTLSTHSILKGIGWSILGLFLLLETLMLLGHIPYLFNEKSQMEDFGMGMQMHRGVRNEINDTILYNKFFAHYHASDKLHWFAHIIMPYLWWPLSFLQLLDVIRAKSIGTHRWMGRITIVAGLISCLSGAVLGLRSAFGLHITVASLCIFFPLFTSLAMAWYYAWNHDVSSHRRWALRSYLFSFSIILMRPLMAVCMSMSREYLNAAVEVQAEYFRRAFEVSLWSAVTIMLFVTEPIVNYVYPIKIKEA